MKILAPVVVFVYNRLEHTKNLLQSLEQCRLVTNTELFIFADAPAHKAHSRKKVEAVWEYLEQYNTKSHFKRVSIVKAKQHKGLAQSVISGISEIIVKYKNVIVLEDDLMVSRDFLEYMNKALAYYKKDKKIWSISGYTPPIPILRQYTQDVFMGYRGHSWGYATWLDRWKQVDWEVKDFKLFQYNIFARNRFNRGGNDLSTMLCIQMRGGV